MGWSNEQTRFVSQQRKETYFSPKQPDTICGLVRILFNVIGAYSPGKIWPVREVDYSAAADVEIKNERSYTFPLPYAFKCAQRQVKNSILILTALPMTNLIEICTVELNHFKELRKSLKI